MSSTIFRTVLVMGIAMGIASLAGCTTVGPDFHRPVAALPDHWQGNAVKASANIDVDDPDATWWTIFNDAELSSLIERATAANLDIKAASARWLQARAAQRMTGAQSEPRVDGTVSYQHARSSQNGLLDISGLDGKKSYTLWQPGLDASWELDLWGRVRRDIESSGAMLQASAEDRRAVLLSVLAETARDYIQLRGVQARQAIIRQNLDIAEHSQRLMQIRFADGVATKLELAEASAQISRIEADVPDVENDRVRLVNAISYLLGEPPRSVEHELEAAVPVPPVPRAVPLGVPSELAERRPDIREAEARLHAATADIGVAVGDFYPRITLSAGVDLQAMHFGDLAHRRSGMFGIGPAISVPIFEGGRLKGQLALRKAQQLEAMIGFQRTVLGAWHEVDDAMSDYDTRQQRHEKLAVTVDQDRIALDNATRQYTAGATDFLQVLTVQRDLLAAQQALVASSTDVSLALVGLYKALGGGWQTSFPDSTNSPAGANSLVKAH